MLDSIGMHEVAARLETDMSTGQIIAILAPLIVLQLVLMGLGLYDLTRPERRVKGGNKWVWGVVIVLGELLGPIVYFFYGREDA